MAEERLQKILAAAGLGSRRFCETLITEGRVSVDGDTVTELGTKADPWKQKVRCDGEIVRPRRKVYYLLNKPRGTVCTNDDERGRPRAIDLLPNRDERLFTIGRLDADTEGLIIVTNDGAFTQKVAHPRHGITKTYRAHVQGKIGVDAKNKLLSGIWILGHACKAMHVRIVRSRKRESLVDLTMQEGRNREVRRMLAKSGHRVLNLTRIRIGYLEAPELRPGKWRKLAPDEVKGLLTLGSSQAPAKRKRKVKRPRKPSQSQTER